LQLDGRFAGECRSVDVFNDEGVVALGRIKPFRSDDLQRAKEDLAHVIFPKPLPPGVERPGLRPYALPRAEDQAEKDQAGRNRKPGKGVVLHGFKATDPRLKEGVTVTYSTGGSITWVPEGTSKRNVYTFDWAQTIRREESEGPEILCLIVTGLSHSTEDLFMPFRTQHMSTFGVADGTPRDLNNLSLDGYHSRGLERGTQRGLMK